MNKVNEQGYVLRNKLRGYAKDVPRDQFCAQATTTKRGDFAVVNLGKIQLPVSEAGRNVRIRIIVVE